LNSEKIWKIQKKSKLKCEMIWKIWKKGKLNNDFGWNFNYVTSAAPAAAALG
jgi:hypothetical protein